ncbi:hypothetical protein [Nonomuraea basaltis]|uniref:hypothetical protein n=1 Tax=Nonomuraea basaltis TaxID=2495887 RepID=UPI00110C4080|nr:hypothetical protein [Nonomuraea basaltis]TMR96935.1 hypothetical protein EJK15_20345 [Nonomuraea basaltis]
MLGVRLIHNRPGSSMGFVDVHVQAIEECRQEVLKVRNMLDFNDAFVDGKTTPPKDSTSAGIFGELEGASDLATKIDDVWGKVKTELGWAQSCMKDVEGALGTVASNFRTGERASGA